MQNACRLFVLATDLLTVWQCMQNMLVMRFGNLFLSSVWSRQHIDNIQIVMKEAFGTEGRGGYFDKFGIIRDVIQNHLLQACCSSATTCATCCLRMALCIHPTFRRARCMLVREGLWAKSDGCCAALVIHVYSVSHGCQSV